MLPDLKVKIFLTLNVNANIMINEPQPDYCVRIEVNSCTARDRINYSLYWKRQRNYNIKESGNIFEHLVGIDM